MDSSQNIELTGTRTIRTCKYRVDQPCLQPFLNCTACPHYLPDAHDGLVRESLFGKLAKEAQGLSPYVKLEGPLGEPAAEIGIKVTF